VATQRRREQGTKQRRVSLLGCLLDAVTWRCAYCWRRIPFFLDHRCADAVAGLPSGRDLDCVAAEETAREATGEVAA
jgi:hypothetical protein